MSKNRFEYGPHEVTTLHIKKADLEVRSNQSQEDIAKASANGDWVLVVPSTEEVYLRRAGPELLEQLKYVTTCMRMWLGERSTEVCDESDRIIAKAEGR